MSEPILGIDLGTTNSEVAVIRDGKPHVFAEDGDPILPSVRELTAGVRAGLVIDQLDHAWFPQGGYAANVAFYGATKALGSALNYQRVSGLAYVANSWGAHTLNLAVSGGTDFGSGMPAYESFTLGGPLRLSGFRVNQFAGREYAFGRAMYYNRVFPLPDILGAGVFAGASAEIGKIRDRVDGLPSPGTLYSGSLFLGAQTVAGPGYLGVGFGNSGAFSIYLLLGAP